MSPCCCQCQGFRHFSAAFQFGPLTIILLFFFCYLSEIISSSSAQDFCCSSSHVVLEKGISQHWEAIRVALAECFWREVTGGGQRATGENSGTIQELGKSQGMQPRIVFLCNFSWGSRFYRVDLWLTWGMHHGETPLGRAVLSCRSASFSIIS